MLASACSPFGIGSDIVGSIRSPASFCGCTGFRTTGYRISMKGIFKPAPSLQGFQPIIGVHGPVGKTVDDCILYLKSYLNEKNYS